MVVLFPKSDSGLVFLQNLVVLLLETFIQCPHYYKVLLDFINEVFATRQETPLNLSLTRNGPSLTQKVEFESSIGIVHITLLLFQTSFTLVY